MPPWRSTIIWKCASASPNPGSSLQQTLSLELERRFPQRFIPRYSMVMFHHEIPYRTRSWIAEPFRRSYLSELTERVSRLEDVDFGRAEREILAKLPPVG